MTEKRNGTIAIAPSPTPPTEVELAAWGALPRDEQVARYRETLQHPDIDRIGNTTMADILTVARKREAARRRA